MAPSARANKATQKFRDKYPGGMAGLCDKYRGRLSHVSVVSLESVEDARWFVKDIRKGLPAIHHLSGIAPANPYGVDEERLSLQDRISRLLKASWCGEDIGIWSIGPYSIPYFAPPPLEESVCDMIVSRLETVKRGSSIPFLAEIPSCSFVAGAMSLGDFFRRLTSASGCGMVLDLSHVVSYALFTGAEPEAVLRSLPLDAAVEFHVAGGRVHEKHFYRYLDTHSHPIMDEVMRLLPAAIGSCPNLRAITYEIGVELPPVVIESDLARLENAISDTGFAPSV